MNKTRFAGIAIMAGIATELSMHYLGLGVPYLNGCLATITVTIIFFNKSGFARKKSASK
jgi:hypothetical protein